MTGAAPIWPGTKTVIHLFCAQVLLENGAGGVGAGGASPLPIPTAVEAGGRGLASPVPLIGLTAREHLQKARDYAREVLDLSHLYESPNPDFYKDIPEYEMMKRGMTEEEREEFGYRAVLQMAERLGKD